MNTYIEESPGRETAKRWPPATQTRKASNTKLLMPESATFRT